MRIIFTLTVFLFLANITFSQVNAGEKAPNLILKDLRGRSIKIRDYKGKVVIMNFWATWCPPCRAEIPELILWQKEYRKQGLQIIGITYPPTDLAEVKNYARKTRFNYPILLGSGKTKALFTGSETMPFTVVIGRDGNISQMIEGIIYADEFDEKIMPLLKIQNQN